ncbi:hypothetical protein [Streptomyces cinnamoneus]
MFAPVRVGRRGHYGRRRREIVAAGVIAVAGVVALCSSVPAHWRVG